MHQLKLLHCPIVGVVSGKKGSIWAREMLVRCLDKRDKVPEVLLRFIGDVVVAKMSQAQETGLE